MLNVVVVVVSCSWYLIVPNFKTRQDPRPEPGYNLSQFEGRRGWAGQGGGWYGGRGLV